MWHGKSHSGLHTQITTTFIFHFLITWGALKLLNYYKNILWPTYAHTSTTQLIISGACARVHNNVEGSWGMFKEVCVVLKRLKRSHAPRNL